MVHQVALNTLETIRGKLTFDRVAHQYGVVVKTYHTENGIFNAEEFMRYLFKSEQKMEFIDTGPHHHN